MTDQDKLLDGILKGDKNRYREIVLSYQQAIYAYLIQMVRDPLDSEDLLQETFIAAYQSLDSYKFNDQFSSWLYRIAHNKAVNHLKKKSRLTKILFVENTIAAPQKIDSHYLDKDLDKALNSLKPSERSLLYLRVYEEMRYHEISKIMKQSPATLRKRF